MVRYSLYERIDIVAKQLLLLLALAISLSKTVQYNNGS